MSNPTTLTRLHHSPLSLPFVPPFHLHHATPSSSEPITNKRINPMTTRAKTPQLHFLPTLNLPRITVTPLQRHVRICIRIHQDVKGTFPCVELWEKCYGGGDLSEDGLDLGLDLSFGFFFCRGGC